MNRRCLLAVGILVLLTRILQADDWKYDVVHLKNGQQFEGLVIAETKEGVQFKFVVRKPGIRTLVVETFFSQEEVDRIERLSAAERKELARRIDLLDPRGEREEARMEALKLAKVRWDEGEAWRYQGRYFELTSNAREDIVRRVIVRLEEVFAAYTKYLDPRRQPKRLTQIVLYKTLPEYQAVLKGAGLNILNPAYYDPQKNQIVAASDLERLAGEWDKVRQKHEELLQELKQQEQKLRKHFHGQPPSAMLAQLRQLRRDIEVLNTENKSTLDRLHQPLFTRLYHEAFHAYLDNFVYPSREGTLPRWFNEGLAQIFETALVETGELRVGHVDKKRLSTVKGALRREQLVSLKDLLASDWQQFHVAHASEAQAADRYFLTSWALAYYLTFDRKLLRSPALDRYVAVLHRSGNPLAAFQELVGQPLDEFEPQFHDYLRRLRPDGTLAPPPEK